MKKNRHQEQLIDIAPQSDDQEPQAGGDVTSDELLNELEEAGAHGLSREVKFGLAGIAALVLVMGFVAYRGLVGQAGPSGSTAVATAPAQQPVAAPPATIVKATAEPANPFGSLPQPTLTNSTSTPPVKTAEPKQGELGASPSGYMPMAPVGDRYRGYQPDPWPAPPVSGSQSEPSPSPPSTPASGALSKAPTPPTQATAGGASPTVPSTNPFSLKPAERPVSGESRVSTSPDRSLAQPPAAQPNLALAETNHTPRTGGTPSATASPSTEAASPAPPLGSGLLLPSEGPAVSSGAWDIAAVRTPSRAANEPSTPPQQLATAAPTPGRQYVVRTGDTIFTIARNELGKATRWVEIYELNRDVLAGDIENLAPGARLVLPAEANSPATIARRPPMPAAGR